MSSKPATGPPAGLDTLVAHLHRCMQTPAGIDTVLQFLCFSSGLGAAAAGRVAAQAPGSRLLELSQRLRSLSGVAAEARMVCSAAPPPPLRLSRLTGGPWC
jgi:hypothetical protein